MNRQTYIEYAEETYISTMAHAQPKPTADPTPCNRCRWFMEKFAPCDFSSGVRHACPNFQHPKQ